MRHGQSTWNLENRFTGWVDVPLTELGKTEAARGGKALKAEGFQFDVAYTSVLKRAIKVRRVPDVSAFLPFLPRRAPLLHRPAGWR